ncbi:MAG TPA: beta-ketoacyl-[acyl-carrier-protein] synthase family protein [Gammaproteobacteria bacterium]|nr:beta-ketoacyl-[acyl-carrier-protein] synthase family protein [Gammaproteobacteria bacterium]
MFNRVAITGLGIVSPLGCCVKKVWGRLIQGDSGIKIVEGANHNYRSKLAALVEGFNDDGLLSSQQFKRFDKFINYGVSAADQAIRHAAVADYYDPHRTSVIAGSGIGGLNFLEKNITVANEAGARRISPYFIPGTLISSLPGVLSARYGAKGPCFSVVTACATGAHNIIMAAQLIASGQADMVITGGAENFEIKTALGGFGALRALSSSQNFSPQESSRPWDKDRDGFICSEGSGMIVLEREDLAKKRGQNILAYLSGFGMSSDAYSHITRPSPDGEGIKSVMHQSMMMAGVIPEDIGYINAHATSTPVGDQVELNAIKEVFEGRGTTLKVSSTKSSLGHALGAAGSMEAIFCIQALQNQMAPPTINCINLDGPCEFDLLRRGADVINTRYVLSNSFGFGGQNASLLFEKSDH